MTKKEAKDALSQGKRVTHKLFSEGEHIVRDDAGILRDEAGNDLHGFWDYRKSPAWDTDWEIVKNDKPDRALFLRVVVAADCDTSALYDAIGDIEGVTDVDYVNEEEA